MKREAVCPVCGKPVAVTDPNDRRSRFCSGRCERLYWKHRRTKKAAPADGQTMERKTI